MAAKKKAKGSEVRTFEEAMEELESLVEAMEGDQLPLEELVAHYEKGAGLLQPVSYTHLTLPTKA